MIADYSAERIVIMTIEESVRNDSTKFEALLETKTPEFKKALEELSVRLDSIIGAMLKEYSTECLSFKNYIRSFPDSTIGDEYSNPHGQGRIIVR